MVHYTANTAVRQSSSTSVIIVAMNDLPSSTSRLTAALSRNGEIGIKHGQARNFQSGAIAGVAQLGRFSLHQPLQGLAIKPPDIHGLGTHPDKEFAAALIERRPIACAVPGLLGRDDGKDRRAAHGGLQFRRQCRDGGGSLGHKSCEQQGKRIAMQLHADGSSNRKLNDYRSADPCRDICGDGIGSAVQRRGDRLRLR